MAPPVSLIFENTKSIREFSLSLKHFKSPFTFLGSEDGIKCNYCKKLRVVQGLVQLYHEKFKFKEKQAADFEGQEGYG